VDTLTLDAAPPLQWAVMTKLYPSRSVSEVPSAEIVPLPVS